MSVGAAVNKAPPMEGRPIYLDYNATTPIDRDVAAAMQPLLADGFGNPSSGHLYGRVAKQAVDAARASVAALIGCFQDEVLFTSGGTESNNWAIKGAARRARAAGRGARVVTTAVEHPAVAEVAAYLREDEGFEVATVPVSPDGVAAADDVVAAATVPGTVLVSIMHANNEVGSLQPVAEVAARLAGRGILVHTDASQSVGKVPLSWRDLDVDLLTIAGHKLYAPKGVGALVVRRGTDLGKLMHGAGHEGGMRAGTESTVLIAALGKACEIARVGMERHVSHAREMRDSLLAELEAQFAAAPFHISYRVNGPPDPALRLPNTLSISIAGISAPELIETVQRQVALSAGSACHAGSTAVSPVLEAMGVPREYALGTLRLSVGRETTLEEVRVAADVVASAVQRLLVREREKGTSKAHG